MPLRLDNARALPTCPQQEQQTKKTFKPRFKVDHAASPMPETRPPERLAPRATSNRNGGRDHLGILGEIKSVHPGDIIGISSLPMFSFLQKKLNGFSFKRSLRPCMTRAASF